MICSKNDYLFYLEADKKALNIEYKKPKLFRDEVWRFQRLLRKVEYYTNCKHGVLDKVYTQYLKFEFHKLSVKLGFSIPINVCEAGLNIAHIGTIVINPSAKIGKNCRIHIDVNIGAAGGHADQVPQIGDNVYIGPGAKIFGGIKIANGIAIGANSVVNKSFEEENISIAGVPARKINEKGSLKLIKKGA